MSASSGLNPLYNLKRKDLVIQQPSGVWILTNLCVGILKSSYIYVRNSPQSPVNGTSMEGIGPGDFILDNHPIHQSDPWGKSPQMVSMKDVPKIDGGGESVTLPIVPHVNLLTCRKT